MTAAPAELSRDLLAGLLPWCPYWIGIYFGHPDLGAALAALALLALRLEAWPALKVFDLVILAFLVIVGLQRCCLDFGPLGTYRPILLPTLLAIAAFVSSAAGHPCTVQYAREMVNPEWWQNYHFIRVNHILTLLWGFDFLGMAWLGLYAPRLGPLGWIVSAGGSMILLGAAAWITHWFPRWYRLHYYLPRVRAGKESFIRTLRR